MTESTPGLWATLSLRETERMLAWLSAIGFVEHAVYRNESDPTVVEHAELLWPAGGGVMLGTHRDNPRWPKQPGAGATYLVCDDPDAAFEAGVAAGGEVLDPMGENDYGGRGGSLRDPEGNLWSFGSYRPG